MYYYRYSYHAAAAVLLDQFTATMMKVLYYHRTAAAGCNGVVGGRCFSAVESEAGQGRVRLAGSSEGIGHWFSVSLRL